jgi:hypothetical protein
MQRRNNAIAYFRNARFLLFYFFYSAPPPRGGTSPSIFIWLGGLQGGAASSGKCNELILTIQTTMETTDLKTELSLLPTKKLVHEATLKALKQNNFEVLRMISVILTERGVQTETILTSRQSQKRAATKPLIQMNAEEAVNYATY